MLNIVMPQCLWSVSFAVFQSISWWHSPTFCLAEWTAHAKYSLVELISKSEMPRCWTRNILLQIQYTNLGASTFSNNYIQISNLLSVILSDFNAFLFSIEICLWGKVIGCTKYLRVVLPDFCSFKLVVFILKAINMISQISYWGGT